MNAMIFHFSIIVTRVSYLFKISKKTIKLQVWLTSLNMSVTNNINSNN